MSGPAVGLWIFEPCAFEDILAGVVPWLETFCEPVETEAGGDLAFRVRDASPLGLQGVDSAGVGGFFLSEDEYLPADDEDYSAFPTPPVQGLVLSAGCSGPENHLLLGHLALAMARRLGALVDFDGVLGYPTPRDETRNEADLAEARALVASLPGKVAEVSYDTGGGGRWFRHVGDVEFMAAWLRHPDFHLSLCRWLDRPTPTTLTTSAPPHGSPGRQARPVQARQGTALGDQDHPKPAKEPPCRTRST